MIILTKKVDVNLTNEANLKLYLTFEERTKTRQKISFKVDNKEDCQYLKLELIRGTILKEGDILTNETEDFFVEIKAKPEPVVTVKTKDILSLLKLAYHLGNRHVNLEINENYLRFSPDHVLESMVSKLGANIERETAPFSPESGAYKHNI